MDLCIGLKLKMTTPKQVTMTLMLFLAILTPKLVVSQYQPNFFNYQPQQHQPQYQHQPPQYQPFSNPPPYYTPSYESHSPGGSPTGGPELLGNFFNDGFSPAPTAPASSPLVPYPTQVSTLDGARHHLSPQQYQPVGNSIVQPTLPSTPNTNNPFRPSPLINHHTHIVNGLPRQQFFGNNYAFLRDIHGLQGFPTSNPYLGQNQNTLQPVAPTVKAPSPTPVALASTSATPNKSAVSASPSKISESKPNPTVRTLALDLPSRPSPPTTQSTFLSRFPFQGPSTFSPATSQRQSYNPVTTPAPRIFPTAQPSRSSPHFGVSPSYQFSQNFAEPSDSIDSNELARQPLFQEEDEEDDEFTVTYNGKPIFNNQARQVTSQQPQQRPQIVSTAPITASPVPALKAQQQTSSFNNAKDEPIRIHNTQPIRIVFNYEQAAQALEEDPGVRVVIAHTEKNNLTQDEFSTTVRPYVTSPSPYSETATVRSGTSPAVFQPPTTARPTQNYGTYRPAVPTTYRPSVSQTYRPVVSSTPRPQPRVVSPTPRFQYQPVNVPYNIQTANDEGTAALENLALELEGRFDSTGRPIQQVSQQPYYETVATLATEPTPTEDPLKTYKRGGKKYVVIPNSGSKVYKAEEPRVVVNDLANIYVQTVQPGGHYSATPPSTFPRQTFQQPPQQYQPVQEVGQAVDDDDLSEEIAHLNQQLQQDIIIQTTARPKTTTTTTPRPPQTFSSPQPRRRPSPTPRLLRITTYRPPFTFPSSTFRSTTTTTTTTSPPPPPPRLAPEEEDNEYTLPEVNNQLTSGPPPSLTGRKQPKRYYYNNRPGDGLPGAYQRYEYNGADGPSPPPSAPQEQQAAVQQQTPKRRRVRPRGRLVAGGPPRAVQVNGGPPGPVVGPEGFPPPLHFGAGLPFGAGPGGPLGPPGGPLGQLPGPGQVFRVGPRGRLLRRKSRPRAQLQGQQPSLAPSAAPSTTSSLSPSPFSPPVLPPQFSPVQQDIGPSQFPPVIRGIGPSQFPPGPRDISPSQFPPFSPTPFIPQELVTTYRPGPPPNAVINQRLVEEEDERKRDRPNAFRSRFRTAPSKPTTTSASVENDEEEGASNQSSEEEAPVPQRRRPQFSTTTTTEKPEERAPVASDRANILQRQIRFNRNRKNQNQRNNKDS